MKKIIDAVYRVESHFVKPGSPAFYECDDICWKGKNLYNQGNFRIRLIAMLVECNEHAMRIDVLLS